MEQVSKHFGNLEILKKVDLIIERGESISIVGPSGAGKSTLLHIAGLMEPATTGLVEIENEPITKLNEMNRSFYRLNKIGFLFQFHHLLPDFNVLENVLIPCRLAGDRIDKSEKEAKTLLDRLGLAHRLSHKPSQLSGGEQQRTALARALIRKPSLLLCDEPTGNLDPTTAKNVISLLWEEVKTLNLAVLIVTHNHELAAQTDRAFTLEQGVLKKTEV